MKNILTITKKELASYFNSPIAYIFIAVFLVITNWLFFQSFFLVNQASMRDYFMLLPWIFLFLAPAVTMRSFAEEKRSGSIELLLTLPLRDWEVTLGKFFSSLAFIAITLIISLPLAFTVNNLGNLDKGVVFTGYLGALFLAGAYLALGIFISSLTRNQIIAFILSLASAFLFFILGSGLVVSSVPGFLGAIFHFAALGTHFENIAKGLLDSRDIIYYVSFIFFFLWLTVRNLESRNWK